MKFDVCLLNPPYSPNLAYDFLAKSISCSNKAISIQPCSFLYGDTRTKKKYKDSICDHISDFEIIKIRDAKQLFNIVGTNDLGIFVCDECGGYDYENLLSHDSIVDKIRNYVQYNKCPIETNKKDGYRLRVSIMTCGHSGGSGDRGPILTSVPIKDIVFVDGKHDGKWWYEYYQRNQFSKTTENITTSVRFDTEQEAHNFHKSMYTKLSRYYMDKVIISRAVPDIGIIWMKNAVHPRTGTIGYKDVWTNEDYYKYFNITDEEQNTIETFIDDYDRRHAEYKLYKNSRRHVK